MKVLVSAYCCNPYSGSEPFLGWRWSYEIAKHHTVFVITRSDNRPHIERYSRENKLPDNLHFAFVECGSLLEKLELIIPYGVQLYYYFWQKLAAEKAKELHKIYSFDIVHHIAFGAFTQPTYMQELGIPFVWGPLGGGERMPKIIGRKLDLRSKKYELIRNLRIRLYNHFSFTKAALKGASKIFVTTEGTYSLVPKQYRYKTEIFQSLGMDENFMSKDVEVSRSDNRIKVLVVGRMIGWKGFDIAIDAFKKLVERRTNVDLYLRGEGELKHALINRCGSLLNKRIFFVNTYFDYEDMYGFYKSHDIFLNCTLHDSGCLALLEAMSAGLPCIIIDTGGPHIIATEENALKIPPQPIENLTNAISKAIVKLADNELLRKNMGIASKKVVENNYMYNVKYKTVERVYEEITHHLYYGN